MTFSRSVCIAAIGAALVANLSAGQYSSFATAKRAAEQAKNTSAGYNYMVKFCDAMDIAVGQAMRSCMPNSPGRKTDIRYDVIFVVGADGRVQQVFTSPGSKVGACFTQTLKAPRVPRPPRDGWPVIASLVHGP